MPNINEMRGPSKYLTKDDVGKGLLVTIKGVEKRNLAQEGKPAEYRWLLWTQENEKGLVLNQTNIQIIAMIADSEDTDDWTGLKVVLYVDPHVSYGGKLVGGIRIREPKAGTPADKSNEQLLNAERNDEPGELQQLTDDDIPF